MKRPSLLRQLVGVHVAVVAASCLVLAAAAGLVANSRSEFWTNSGRLPPARGPLTC